MRMSAVLATADDYRLAEILSSVNASHIQIDDIYKKTQKRNLYLSEIPWTKYSFVQLSAKMYKAICNCKINWRKWGTKPPPSYKNCTEIRVKWFRSILTYKLWRLNLLCPRVCPDDTKHLKLMNNGCMRLVHFFFSEYNVFFLFPCFSFLCSAKHQIDQFK